MNDLDDIQDIENCVVDEMEGSLDRRIGVRIWRTLVDTNITPVAGNQ
jgi:hypothetical protein